MELRLALIEHQLDINNVWHNISEEKGFNHAFCIIDSKKRVRGQNHGTFNGFYSTSEVTYLSL
jgi:hypothetical protein